MAKKFPSELSSRGTVKVTDKLLIHNIDTGESCYCTVTQLLAALSIYGNVGIGTDAPQALLNIRVLTNDVECARISTAGGDSGTAVGITYLGFSPWSTGIYPHAWMGVYEDGIANYEGGLTLGTRGAASDSAPSERVRVTSDGKVGIGTSDPTAALHVVGLTEYADNAAAVAAGLTAGAFYRTGDTLKVVHA
jgi:hypothetical protein